MSRMGGLLQWRTKKQGTVERIHVKAIVASRHVIGFAENSALVLRCVVGAADQRNVGQILGELRLVFGAL